MKAQARIGARFTGQPDDIGVDRIYQVGGWEWGNDLATHDLVQPVIIPSGYTHKVNLQAIRDRAVPRAKGTACYLNFEPGRQASMLVNWRGVEVPDKLRALLFGGTILSALRAEDIHPDLWYGIGWLPLGGEVDEAEEVVNDMAACGLAGNLPRVAVSYYGPWSQHWGGERFDVTRRAQNLRDAGGPRPVFFISPVVNKASRIAPDDYGLICRATRRACEVVDADVVHWDDPGRVRTAYAGSEAEPCFGVFREVFAGFEGVST